MDFIMDIANLPDSPESRLRAVENKIKCMEESTYAMKVYRNALVPISRLPDEIFRIIFSILRSFEVLDLKYSQPILIFHVFHVCHRWHEISLNHPLMWNHINFTKLTPAGAAEMLVRAKMAPLYLEARTTKWSKTKLEAFKQEIEAHIHHTRHLNIMVLSKQLGMLGQLVSPAPSLESLSIDVRRSCRTALSPVIIPDDLFDGMAHKLTQLRLYYCGIRWHSPLLKGLRDLELFSFPKRAQPAFYSWLRALEQIPQLERLVLHDSIPSDLVALSEGVKFTVDLPSLTELCISTYMSECMVLLVHLVLPALTRLCVNAQMPSSISASLNDLNHLIRCVAQNAHGLQDTEALQSLFIWSRKTRTAFVAWTMPRQDPDDGLRSLIALPDRTRLARLEFSIEWPWWVSGIKDIQHYTLAALPLNSTTNLTVKGHTPLGKEDWRSHLSRWPKLERVRLSDAVVPAFREMIEDAAKLGDRLLPLLEELVLVDISLDAEKVYYLCDMLMECLELGIPLRTLDIRTCTVANRAVRLLNEIVVDVQAPAKNKQNEVGRVTPALGSWVISERDNDASDTDRFDLTFKYIDYSWDDSWDDASDS